VHYHYYSHKSRHIHTCSMDRLSRGRRSTNRSIDHQAFSQQLSELLLGSTEDDSMRVPPLLSSADNYMSPYTGSELGAALSARLLMSAKSGSPQPSARSAWSLLASARPSQETACAAPPPADGEGIAAADQPTPVTSSSLRVGSAGPATH